MFPGHKISTSKLRDIYRDSKITIRKLVPLFTLKPNWITKQSLRQRKVYTIVLDLVEKIKTSYFVMNAYLTDLQNLTKFGLFPVSSHPHNLKRDTFLMLRLF